MNQDNKDIKREIAELSDEELFDKYIILNKLLFGKPYPYSIAGDMAYFTLVAEELRKRGFKGRGIGEPEPGQALEAFIEENVQSIEGGQELKREQEGLYPQLVVAYFCRAIVHGEYSTAVDYCHPARAEEVVEDFRSGMGKLRDYKHSGKVEMPDKEIEGTTYPCCTIEGKALWDYEGDVEAEDWTFELIEVDGEWKIC